MIIIMCHVSCKRNFRLSGHSKDKRLGTDLVTLSIKNYFFEPDLVYYRMR